MTRPKLVFGTMTFGNGVEGRITDQSHMQQILNLLLENGIDELDTARMYSQGNCEQVLENLKVQRHFKLATKAFPFTPGLHSRDLLKKQFKESLAALKSEKVDIFYLHAPDDATAFEETLEACNDLYKAGHFVELGLSNYSAWQVMEISKICEAKGFVKPTVYQGRYSLLTRDIEQELIKCLRKLKIRFYAYNPLCGGLLAGKDLGELDQMEGRFDKNTVQGKRYRYTIGS